MATTTNYGWTTPDDTALVKDGASAIRTLGTSIDTTTKNLNPSTTLGDIEYRSSTANVNTRLPLGTAGQVLKVNSGATAPEWSSDNAGMTNPMTTTGDTIYSSSGSTPARLGIGSSGQALTVVAGVPSWAASATSTLTTTGDTLYASSANTLARLAVGSTGNVLTVAGGVPTWAAPSGGGQSYSLISTTNTNSGATVTVSGLSSYKNIIMVFNNVSCNTTNQYHYVKINGSSTALDYKQVATAISTPSTYGTAILSGSSQFNSGNSSGITVSYNGSATSTTLSGYFMIENAQNTGVKSCFFQGKAGAATNAEAYSGMAMFGGAAVSNISIEVGSGAFQSGTLLLYGSTT